MDVKIIFVLLTIFFSASTILIVREDDIKYFLYSSENPMGPTQFNRGNLTNIPLSSSRPVKIIIHGFDHNAQGFWIAPMKDAYFSKGFTNVIVIDWSAYNRLSNTEYTLAVILAKGVGNYVGDVIYDLCCTLGVAVKDIHMIGFDVGAHIAGFAGQRISTYPDSPKLGRISALNPAGQGFNDITTFLDDRLSNEDAIFIDTIYTSSTTTYQQPLGHVTFYPNGDQSQPGCNGVEQCNHNRVLDLFIESINGGSFDTRKCGSYGEYKQGLCSDGKKNIMGEYAEAKRGVYYLDTHGEKPFACGASGC